MHFTPDPAAQKVSGHPPHLLDIQGRPTDLPAAFIPFCAYGGNLSVLSGPLGDMKSHVCNKFKPYFMDGQLCYNLNLSSTVSTKEMKTEPGKHNAIFFAVDFKPVQLFGNNEIRNENLNYLYSKSSIGEQLNIHINTLSRISDTRPGLYVMTVMKKMTGTESFLALPDETKGCQLEPQDECKKRLYAEEARKQCGCVPWSLSTLLPEQVGTEINNKLHIPRTGLQATAALTAPPATPA